MPINFYLYLDKLILKFIWKQKPATIARETLNLRAGELVIPAYKE